MPPRSTWKGYLKLSLVSVPVKAYTSSVSGGGQIHLNQLHEECHRRIRYQKVCPEHGEVPYDEIVSGYEFAKGQYVVVDPSELDKLRSESDKSVTVDSFVSADEIDPIYLSGKAYYLVPDGPIGQKPYALIHQAMVEENVQAVAQVVLSGKENLVLIRPVENLLTMSVLNYEAQVKQPAAFEDELTEIDADSKEVTLTRQLIGALVAEDFDYSQYVDTYTQKLTQLIEAKVEGKELVAPPSEEEPQIINLMDALKASVQQLGGDEEPASTKKRATKKKPARKTAASKTKRKTKKKAAKRQRKSG